MIEGPVRQVGGVDSAPPVIVMIGGRCHEWKPSWPPDEVTPLVSSAFDQTSLIAS